MSRAKHLVLLLTVTALMANPLVACCLGTATPTLTNSAQNDSPPAHRVEGLTVDSVTPEEAVALPPCHGQPGAAAATLTNEIEQPPTPAALTLCPACLDCDSSALVPPGTAAPAKDSPATDASLPPELQPPWAEQRPLTLPLAHGPPPAPPRPATTQVSLKQLLLI